MLMGEVRRRKALAKVLEYAVVTDSNGEKVDLTSFVKPAGEEEAAEAPAEETATEQAAETDAK